MKQKFMDLAKKMALHSDHPQHKIGTVLVKKNRIINMGFNKMKTHPRSTHPYRMVHAELDVLLGITPQEIEGSTVYIHRTRTNGSSGLAKPCEHCRKLLTSVGVSSIIYSTDQTFIKEYL